MISRVLISCAVILGLPLASRASFPITKIADTSTPVPGTGGTFTSFGLPTVDREVNFQTLAAPFWFEATSSNGNSGVYVYDANYNAFADLVDTTMTAPTGGKFASFSNVSSGAGEVGFLATDSNGVTGVYAIGDFPLTLIATPTTSPSNGVTFGNFHSISVMGGPYGNMSGEIESDAGIYDFDNYNFKGLLEFTLQANTSTVAPGATGPFTSFGPVSWKTSPLQSSNIPGVAATIRAVRATAAGVEGIYYGSDIDSGSRTTAPLANLISAGATVPDSQGNPTAATFTSFGNPIATSNEITFTAHYSTATGDQQGIFAFGPYVEGNYVPVLSARVATGDIAPDSGGATFTGFSDISDSSTNQVFLASLSDGREGLFIDWPSLSKILETGDTVDGKIIAEIGLSSDAIPYADQVYGIPFDVTFTDGSEGVYYSPLPEPASLCLLALPILLLPIRRRFKQRSTFQTIGATIEPLEERRLLSTSAVAKP